MSHSSMAGEHRYDNCCKLTEATNVNVHVEEWNKRVSRFVLHEYT